MEIHFGEFCHHHFTVSERRFYAPSPFTASSRSGRGSLASIDSPTGECCARRRTGSSGFSVEVRGRVRRGCESPAWARETRVAIGGTVGARPDVALRDAKAGCDLDMRRGAYSGATRYRVPGYRKLVPGYRLSVPPSPFSVPPDRSLDDSGTLAARQPTSCADRPPQPATSLLARNSGTPARGGRDVDSPVVLHALPGYVSGHEASQTSRP